MIGMVIGSASCILSDLTNKLLPHCLSIGINRAAIDFKVDIASTSEAQPIREWLRCKTSAKQFLVKENYAHLCPGCIAYKPSEKLRFEDREDSELFYGARNSALPAIHYLILQGCDTVLLSGIAFEQNWQYYHLDIAKVHEQSHCDEIRESLYQLAKHCNLICINKNSFNPKYVKTITSEDTLFNTLNFSSKV